MADLKTRSQSEIDAMHEQWGGQWTLFPQAEEAPEFVTFAGAAELLGVTRFRISRLVKRAGLQVYANRVDWRKKWLKRTDVLAMLTPMPIDATEG